MTNQPRNLQCNDLSVALLNATQGNVLTVESARVVLSEMRSDISSSFGAIENNEWAELANKLKGSGVIISNQKTLDANEERLGRLNAQAARFIAPSTQCLEHIGSEVETAGTNKISQQSQVAEKSPREPSIFTKYIDAINDLEWAFFTTPLLLGFQRSITEDNCRLGQPEAAPSFVDREYAEFLSKSYLAPISEENAWFHTLKWMAYRSLTPIEQVALIGADDKVAVGQLLSQLRDAREHNEPFLGELEFSATNNFRIEIDVTVSELAHFANVILNEWGPAQHELWLLSLYSIQHKTPLQRVIPESIKIETVLEAFNLEFSEWLLLQSILFESLDTIAKCKEALVKNYETEIAEFSGLFGNHNHNHSYSEQALEIAKGVAEYYDPRGSLSFGELLEAEFSAYSQPPLSANA